MRLIDADALLKKCIEGDGRDKFTEGYNFAVQEISEYIALAPTIGAEPVRHGRWVPHAAYEEYDIAYCDYVCSECGREITKRVLCVPPRCENCGAKMDGGADNG